MRVNIPRGQFDNGGGTTHFRKATGVALNLGINQGRIKGRELPKRLHFSTYLRSVRAVGGQGWSRFPLPGRDGHAAELFAGSPTTIVHANSAGLCAVRSVPAIIPRVPP